MFISILFTVNIQTWTSVRNETIQMFNVYCILIIKENIHNTERWD